MDLRLLGIAAALGSAASWAIGAILFKRLSEVLSPLAMTLVKGAASVLILLAAMLLLRFEPMDPWSLALLGLSGLLGIALGDTLFFAALRDLGPQPLLVLAVLGQVLTVLLAVVWLGETPSASAWVGMALITAGVMTVLQANLAGEKGATGRRGIALGLASVACMSVSMILTKKALGEEADTLQATFYRMLAGTLGMLVLGTATRQLHGWMSPFRDPRLIGRFLVAACVVTFGGFWLSVFAIKWVDVSLASILTSTEPVFALPLAAIFLKEKITLRAVTGTLIALAGVAMLCLPAGTWLAEALPWSK